jgi:glycogen debranching enzyme
MTDIRGERTDAGLSEIIQIEDQFYVRSTSSLADAWTAVLKHGDTFAIFDRHGDIQPIGAIEHGIYHNGTRYLSQRVLRIDGERPLLLSSTVDAANIVLTVDLTNHEITAIGQDSILQGTLHLQRSTFLWNDACYERIVVTNYADVPQTMTLSTSFGADYADIFEVRGMTRDRRGHLNPPTFESEQVHISYLGLDGVTRTTHLRFSIPPDELEEGHAEFKLALPPGQHKRVDTIASFGNAISAEPAPYEVALDEARQHLVTQHENDITIATSNQQFNVWVDRARTDMRMLVTELEEGPYPYAGVPWFSTVFGRDGIITALQMLSVEPRIASGVLRYLASNQATEVDPEREAEPGKILHEVRQGEMAELGEIPFGRYYGSVDVTPLFVMLAGAYYRRTADRDTIETIWPSIEAALGWIEHFGDIDSDGFVEYAQHNTKGLVHQGWKDSHDSIFHADGTDPVAPIALCEVQGYVYAAFRAAAELARGLDSVDRANELDADADRFYTRFNETFWLDELGTYALALDGNKQPCKVRASNAGHCLFTGIVEPGRAASIADLLLSEAMFTGWGVQTLAIGEPRYNPMSYHNGSVWPHDNAIIAAGLARYGLKEQALQIMNGHFDLSTFIDLSRLPELVCGFPRRPHSGPTLYPVACSPQAWAAGSIFMLLDACLGLEIDATSGIVRFNRPRLPLGLNEVVIRNLQINQTTLDLGIHQIADDAGVHIIRRNGPVEVITVR